MQYARIFEEGVCKRPSLRSAARACLLSGLGAFERRTLSPGLRCVFCHYVFDDQIALFERHIIALRRLGTFVDTATCLDMVEGRRAIDGSYLHLSFDDGFKNVLSNAVPVLCRHQVPALFFVPTAFVGAPYEVVTDYCVRVAEYKHPIEMCSWDDLKRLVDKGIDIGSHTRTHARFSEISSNPAQLQDELAGSKQDIEDKLGVECSTISWPFGKVSDADYFSIEAVRNAGYRACYGAFRGTVTDAGVSPFLIPRHHYEPQWPLSHVRYFLSKRCALRLPYRSTASVQTGSIGPTHDDREKRV